MANTKPKENSLRNKVNSQAKEIESFKVDKTLIKQFAQRVYSSIKKAMLVEKHECNLMLSNIFSNVNNDDL